MIFSCFMVFRKKFCLSKSRQDGWIAEIVGSCLGLIGIVGMTKLSQRFPGMALVEILFYRFSWPGKVLAVIYLACFLVMGILATRLFAETYKVIMLDAGNSAYFVCDHYRSFVRVYRVDFGTFVCFFMRRLGY